MSGPPPRPTRRSKPKSTPASPTLDESSASLQQLACTSMMSATADSTMTTMTRTKEEEINALLSEPMIDLWKLRNYCLTEGGLVNDEIRKKAWPKLVGLDIVKLSSIGTNNTNSSSGNKSNTATPKRRTRQNSGNLNEWSGSSSARGSSSSGPALTIQSQTMQHVIDPSIIKSKKARLQVMSKCLDAEQIGMDVSRCTWHLLNGSQRSRRRQMRNKHKKKVHSLLKRKQRRLGNLINLVLLQSYEGIEADEDFEGSKEDKLRYYQGYHDICCIFQSALGGVATKSSSSKSKSRTPRLPFKPDSSAEYANTDTPSMAAIKTARSLGMELPTKVLLQISNSHLRDSMRSNFELLSKALRVTIMPLISALDEEVHAHLLKSEVEPFFAISWIITWFSHDVRDTALVKRLFDVFIASHPTMPIYMSVAMVLHPMNRMEVLDAECDFAGVHNALSHLPRNSSNVGWKFIGGPFDGEYVSGDEEDTDVMSLDTGMMSHDDLTSIRDVERDDDDISVAPSLASSSMFSGDPSRVSFEELIELSLTFMQRIPPRELVALAQRYPFRKFQTETLLEDISSITLLQQPPSWALQHCVPSDNTLRKQLRKKQQNKGKGSSANGDEDVADLKELQKKYAGRVNKDDDTVFNAMVAAGIGPNGDGDIRRKQMLKKGMIRACVVIAMAVGYQFVSPSSGGAFITIGRAAVSTSTISHDKSSASSIATMMKSIDDDGQDDHLHCSANNVGGDRRCDNQLHASAMPFDRVDRKHDTHVPSEPKGRKQPVIEEKVQTKSTDKKESKATMSQISNNQDKNANRKEKESGSSKIKAKEKPPEKEAEKVTVKAVKHKEEDVSPSTAKVDETTQSIGKIDGDTRSKKSPMVKASSVKVTKLNGAEESKQIAMTGRGQKKKFGFGIVQDILESAKKNLAEDAESIAL